MEEEGALEVEVEDETSGAPLSTLAVRASPACGMETVWVDGGVLLGAGALEDKLLSELPLVACAASRS